MKKFPIYFLIIFVALAATGQTPTPQLQTPAESVDTTSRAIVYQIHRAYEFAEDGVSFSNQFAGARLSNVERTGPLSYTVTINPENAPINMSPWYAFKVWGDRSKDVSVRLVYPEYARHRYDPQISNDGQKWRLLEKNRITDEEKGPGTSGPESRPKSIIMRLKIDRKPLWISAQELQNSRTVFTWMDEIANKRDLKISEIGQSLEGRPIKMLTIGKPDSKKMMMVISRQHPPEVTGYFAMQAFVETIAGKSDLAKKFRNEWSIYVVPLMNPDGVDHGNWRHNLGGIDLNRDWTVFNQPEDKTVSDFLKRRETETGGKFYFGIDFHSTWNDIYYPMTRRHEGNMPGLVQDWLTKIQAALPGYTPNIQANDRPLPARVSRNYFLNTHGLEAIVFEIGDNTPREFIEKKGRVGAEQLMRLMMAHDARPANVPASVK
ncbi:MAG: M14 family metallopeptidase [Pyrinomonadaceae bacterium]